MTHEQVRELLPEHLLGSLPELDDAFIAGTLAARNFSTAAYARCQGPSGSTFWLAAKSRSSA